ncbi:hypothetical protein FA10DRAFT_79077 [Acaromyces ingoldii]|uniref:Secreted protein n=1 Tax=Acaromyces ingoldii TaxID=215250 RepID=A0A316YW18_9BASI|nr:hypothetical protein FA10DRAFT_79077 [Acaromyces ingoldii]PWN91965.1 hypothetical protein FA10DRAFT_79077 [Acaromyces ingoldii]
MLYLLVFVLIDTFGLRQSLLLSSRCFGNFGLDRFCVDLRLRKSFDGFVVTLEEGLNVLSLLRDRLLLHVELRTEVCMALKRVELARILFPPVIELPDFVVLDTNLSVVVGVHLLLDELFQLGGKVFVLFFRRL